MREKFLEALAYVWTLITAHAADGLWIVGLGLVAFGVGMISAPAGVIAAGLASCFVGYALAGDSE